MKLISPFIKPSTLADVARHAGVAKSTVSRVMSNDPTLNIRDTTRERIWQVVKQLHYSPNPSARNLRTARSWSTAFIVPDLVNPIFVQTMQGAQAAFLQHHYSLLIAQIDITHPDRELYRRMVFGNRVEGLLVHTTQDVELLADLRRLDAKYVLVNRKTEQDEHCVLLDNEGGVRLAIDYLVEKGHRRIGYISSAMNEFSTKRRHAGYVAALEAHGIPYDPEIFGICKYERDDAERVARHILTATDETPTAIVALNLVIASGITSAAINHGLRVPEQLSVIALNDDQSATMMTPQITTVRFPLFELGRTAADALIGLIEGKTLGRIETILPPEKLVIRQSTAAAPSPN